MWVQCLAADPAKDGSVGISVNSYLAPACVIYEADLPSSPRPDLFAGAHVGLGVGEEGLHCIQRWCRIQLKAQHAKTRSRR
jgi:hypothetical protein